MSKHRLPRIILRGQEPRKNVVRARVMPQHMRWEIGRYRERFSIGPGGVGRAAIWRPDRTGMQHNMVLDNAYELIASYGFTALTNYAAVGTGTSAPDASQTALDSEVVRTNTRPGGETDDLILVSDGLYEQHRAREFSESQVGGQNLTEWGWSPESTSGANLAVRELFRDADGTPITLTLATDQKLRLYYATRIQLGPITQNISLDIDNLGTVDAVLKLFHRYEIGLTHALHIDLDLFNSIASGGSVYAFVDKLADPGWDYNSNVANWKDMAIVAATPEPYTAGSRTRVVPSVTFDTDQANYDITRFGLKLTSVTGSAKAGAQIWFNSPITKDNLHKLIFDSWTLTWGP